METHSYATDTETQIYLATVLCFAVSVFAILAGHWFPWKLVIGRELTRLEAYSYGTVCIVVPPVIAMLAMSMFNAAVLLIVSAVGAGSATIGSYAFDAYTKNRHENMDLQDKLNYAETGNIDQSHSAD